MDLRDLLLQRVSGHKSPLFKSAVRACAEQKPWEEGGFKRAENTEQK